MFALGMRTAPHRPTGHNLLRMASVSVSPSNITLATLKTQVAQEGGGNSPLTDADNTDDSDEPGAIFQDVYSLVKQKYVDTMPTDTQFAHAAAAAMLSSLQDPATRFLEPSDMAELADETIGIYHGLGAATLVRSFSRPKHGETPAYTELQLTIVAPLPGSPAQKAGLIPGDVITNINGHGIATLIDSTGQFDPALSRLEDLKALENDPVSYNKLIAALEMETKTALPMTKAQSLLTDSTQKSLTLTVTRSGMTKPLTVVLDPTAQTTVTPITATVLSGNVGDIKITQLTTGADDQFTTALTSLKPATLKGLIIDLRNCPGGLLSVGQAITEKLTSATSMGILVTKGHRETPIALTPDASVSCPIVVLVNGGTANTAELIAATLQQSGDKVIGRETFGDAGDVRPVALHDGSGFTMTVGTLLTAQGQSFAGRGIKPNIHVADDSSTDASLAHAVELLSARVAQG
jgi:carboxyl-terminal processing protease